MLILGLVLFAIALRVNAIPDGARRIRLMRALPASALVQLLALFFLQQEAWRIPAYLGTTGSDSLDYLVAARNLLHGNETLQGALDEFAGGYTVFCAAILQTSLGESPVLLVLANVLLFQLVLVDLEEVMHLSGFSGRATAWALGLLVLHGSLIWTTIRILKDVLFYFLFLEVLLAVVAWPRRRALNLLRIVLGCAWMGVTRPYSWILTLVVAAFVRTVHGTQVQGASARMRKGLVGVAAAVLIAIGAAYLAFPEPITHAVQHFLQDATIAAVQEADVSSSQGTQFFEQPGIAVGVVRFFLLPFPASMVMASNQFLTYTILVSLGSLLGVATLAYAIRALMSARRLLRNGRGLVLALVVMALGMSATYIVLYSGSAEARHRFPFYIAFAVLAGDQLTDETLSPRWHWALWSALILVNLAYLTF